jgi:hypothetical protein
MMLPETSKTFLDQCKQQGMRFDEVVSQLIQAEWNTEQIEMAKKYYGFGGIVPAGSTIIPEVDVVSGNSSGNQGESNPISKKGVGGVKIGLFVLFGLIFLLAATGVPAYFVATEKLNIGSDAFKSAVTSAIFSIPFIPKTPKYILLAAAEAHKKLAKSSFDISVASQSDDFKNLIGGNNLDAQLKGYVDYSDTKNPKFSLTVNITKEFSVQARKNDKMVYFKVDKLPLAAIAFLGVDPDKLNSILDNWVAFDTSPLETEARKNLDLISKPTSPTDEGVVKFLTKLMNEDILPQIKVSNDKVDKYGTYKLEFAPDAKTLDKIGDEMQQEAISQAKKNNPNMLPTDTQTSKEKLSDHLKDLDIKLWIDNSKYYLRKGVITFSVIPGTTSTPAIISALPLPSMTSPVTTSIALVMSDFGNTVQIQVPDKSVSPEEIYKQIMESSSLFKALDPTKQLAQAHNSVRKNDIESILAAINMYYSDNGKYPGGISAVVKKISNIGANICSALVPIYKIGLPVDPSIGGGAIKSCTGSYDTGYTIVKDAVSGKITVSAPEAELGEVISITE